MRCFCPEVELKVRSLVALAVMSNKAMLEGRYIFRRLPIFGAPKIYCLEITRVLYRIRSPIFSGALSVSLAPAQRYYSLFFCERFAV